MPYWVYSPDNTEPTTGEPFHQRADAHKHAGTYTPRRSVALILSHEERENWRNREADRMYRGEYTALPFPVPTYGAHAPLADHFAHLSAKYPERIAYTPDEDHGYQDRQVAITVGRYLERYLSDFYDANDRQQIIGQIRAMFSAVALARTPDEIERAYTGHRLDSCMGWSRSHYSSSAHPTAVYGDSDLAVAYLGDLDNVRARCIVWPDRKVYGRIYGDKALAHTLRLQGWVAGYDNGITGEVITGSFTGAHVRYISEGSRIVFPYLDVADSAKIVTRDGKRWIVLGEGGILETGETGGLIYANGGAPDEDEDEDDDPEMCEHCTHREATEGSLCSRCFDGHYTCEECNEDIWTSSGDTYEVVGDSYLCGSCAEERASTCEDCGDTWYEENVRRHARHEGHPYCPDCRDNYRECDGCSEWTATEDLDEDDHCEDCREPDEDEPTNANASADAGTVDASANAPVAPADAPDAPIVVISPVVGVSMHGADLARRYVPVLAIVEDGNTFAITARISTADQRHPFVITHVPTGLALTSFASQHAAFACARLVLAFTSPDRWAFTTSADMPNGLSTDALRIVRCVEELIALNSTYNYVPADLFAHASDLLNTRASLSSVPSVSGEVSAHV